MSGAVRVEREEEDVDDEEDDDNDDDAAVEAAGWWGAQAKCALWRALCVEKTSRDPEKAELGPKLKAGLSGTLTRGSSLYSQATERFKHLVHEGFS